MMVPMQYGDAPLDNHFFEKNLQSLKTRTLQPGNLPDILSGKISVISASSGQPTPRFESTLLHSSYDPEKEAHQFAEKLKPGACICLYGFGLGYHLKTILDKMLPLGKLHQEKSQEKKQLPVKSTQGNPLLTDQVMYSYLRTPEYIIQANPDTRVFNLYSHGAEIEQASILGSASELKRRAFFPAA